MRVAVLGLGAMGSRIARRLLDAGHDVVVWNRTREKAEGFPQVAAGPADAARSTDVTITMLTNAEALREVTAGISPPVLIEMSTVGPDAVRELAGRLTVIDAPVLGSRSEAEAGTLHVFVGATPEQYAQWRPSSPRWAPRITWGRSGRVRRRSSSPTRRSSARSASSARPCGSPTASGFHATRRSRCSPRRRSRRRRNGAATRSRRTTIRRASRSPSPAKTPSSSAQPRQACASRRPHAAGSPTRTTRAGANATTPLWSPGF